MTFPLVRAAGDRRDHLSRERLLWRVSGEFRDLPCLRLTARQAQRLFALRQDVCERILAGLVADGTLLRGADLQYRLAIAESSPGHPSPCREDPAPPC
jgi:hypothetical protein